MNDKAKYFSYAIICVVILLALIKVFSNYFSPNPASAFEWEKTVSVYFSNNKMGSSGDCSKVFPVSRTILNAETFGPGALEALLGGVSDTEKAAGYSTSLNDKILLQKFEIKDKVAYVDFDSRFNMGAADSCKVAAIKAQIEKTLDNLQGINSVVVSVNGQIQDILQQ